MQRFGYGIVDRKGKAWWSESCVCEDRSALEDERDNLNSDPDEHAPYRIVALYIRTVRPRRKATRR